MSSIHFDLYNDNKCTDDDLLDSNLIVNDITVIILHQAYYNLVASRNKRAYYYF